MRRVTLLALVASVMLAATSPRATAPQDQPARSPRNANYKLTATLDPVAQTIAASGQLTWRNITRTPTSELRFHLYWNGFRDTKSTWMREQRLGRNPAMTRRPTQDFGGIDVSKLEVAGTNLLKRAEFIFPDDENSDDRTVLSVPLDSPVAPGQTITVDLAWTATVPRTFARTGRMGSYYFVAQWFPKIGVLEETGWNCHQFHASTEFFSDFGVYDVTLNVPRGWVVGATGARQSLTDTPTGGSAHRFVQADVHDFAWTTSPEFLEYNDRFEEPGLPPVEMRLLLQREHYDQVDRHFIATRAALKYYGTWFGAYPYAQITIVDPAPTYDPVAQGESTGGMEYPTLFTAGTRWYSPWRAPQPEAVTVHEAGHQFWYGIVATNEFEHAWMDEGFNTYSTARVIEERYPGRFWAVERFFNGLLPWSYADVLWSRDRDGSRIDAYRLAASADDQSTPSWKYWPATAGVISYNKTALWLATLEKMVGWPTMQRILATHFERGAFRHPKPEDFFSIASEVSGRDLTSFFDAVHRSSASFDYSVQGVVSMPTASGMEHVVAVRRLGDGVFPTSTRVTFTDGTTTDLAWDGRDRWHTFKILRNAPIATVQLDPERVLMLDVNYTNNSWTATPRAAEASRKWAWRWFTWAQELLLTYAFFS